MGRTRSSGNSLLPLLTSSGEANVPAALYLHDKLHASIFCQLVGFCKHQLSYEFMDRTRSSGNSLLPLLTSSGEAHVPEALYLHDKLHASIFCQLVESCRHQLSYEFMGRTRSSGNSLLALLTSSDEANVPSALCLHDQLHASIFCQLVEYCKHQLSYEFMGRTRSSGNSLLPLLTSSGEANVPAALYLHDKLHASIFCQLVEFCKHQLSYEFMGRTRSSGNSLLPLLTSSGEANVPAALYLHDKLHASIFCQLVECCKHQLSYEFMGRTRSSGNSLLM